jgi:carboxyl-terminal processing protease
MQINDTVIDTTARQDVIDQALRGKVENNNGVTIKVLRPTTNEALTFTIAFEEINVPSVIWRVLEQAPEIGYIQILRFTNRTPTELDDAIKDLTAQSIKGVILDMRNNPGGLLQESVQVTGRFLQGGTVLIENNKNGEKSFDAPASPVGIYDLPMIVIINQGTASAAELVAGALQDRGRARSLGTKSYGKGSIQVIFPLADKSSVHITTAEWFTPNKNQINEKGLTPDLPMIPSPDGRDVEINESVRQLREVIK